jgi:hypothetical protein
VRRHRGQRQEQRERRAAHYLSHRSVPFPAATRAQPQGAHGAVSLSSIWKVA